MNTAIGSNISNSQSSITLTLIHSTVSVLLENGENKRISYNYYNNNIIIITYSEFAANTIQYKFLGITSSWIFPGIVSDNKQTLYKRITTGPH